MKWRFREALNDGVAGSLWIRHIAEIVRRGFEEAHDTQWREEDNWSGGWQTGGREKMYGSERVLDNAPTSNQRAAWRAGLFNNSAMRWYVEGETEHSFLSEYISNHRELGIELIDMKGILKNRKGMRLSDEIENDRKHRRYSFILADSDKKENVKLIQSISDHLVGSILLSSPDFEFHNFTSLELVRILSEYYSDQGGDASLILKSDWGEVTNSKDMEKKYGSITKSGSLKGKGWGELLARYAKKNPYHPERAEGKAEEERLRPIVNEISKTWQIRSCNYDFEPNSQQTT